MPRLTPRSRRDLVLATARWCAVACAVGLAAGGGNASAHAGHDHDGSAKRLAGVPDFTRTKDYVRRFDSASGQYRLKQRDLPELTYHVDPAPATGAHGGAEHALPPQELAPVCATSGHRIVPVWHHAPGAGTPNAPALIRSVVRRMNWKISDQSRLSSGAARVLRMRVECDAQGEIVVRDLPSATNDDDLAIRTEATTAFGSPYAADSVKYLIFRDGPDPVFRDGSSAAGVGYGWHGGTLQESVKSANDTGAYVNWNRVYTTGAITWRNYWEKQTPIHELVHVMGGAQNGAPFASAAAHCIDGIDILCYDDTINSAARVSNGYTETRCPRDGWWNLPVNAPLDCGYDTYFDALPEPGEWLAGHWNVGGSENPFLVGAKLASFNGDKYADLIIADSVTNSYAVALNDGAGRLGIYGSGPWEGGWGSRPVWAGVGDFNGDGKTDLIGSDAVNNAYAVSVSTGVALGGPGTQQWLTNWDGTPNWGGVGDFNGDGLDDLVIADEANNAYGVAISTGSRLTGPGTGIWLTGYGSRPDWAGVGDFNGDGKDDLLIVEAANLRYRVMLSDGSRFGAAGSGIWQTGWGRPDWGGIGDFNGDGSDDFIVSSGTSHTYAVSVSTGRALGGPGTQQWLSGWDGRPNVAGVGDFNGDGKDDLIVSDDDNGRYGVAVSDGSRLNGSGFWLTGWNSAPAWGAVSR